MGLAERRAAKEFADVRFPGLKAEIDHAAGFALDVEVDWESLAKDGEAHLYNDCWPDVYFRPLALALRQITRDELGAEAVKAGVKSVKVQNQSGCYYGDRWAHFDAKSGRLLLDHEPHTNVGSIDERVSGLVKAVEDEL